MPERWRLNRAGILNVFQYDDEILHFRGGRLLLRGVNGSGKSTAMNMLLPFLLEADARRIDAAGEQTSVLRSWMLSGREEQQPIGYLWIEFKLADGSDAGGTADGDGRDGDEARVPRHLVCGCGIKANRSTDSVTPWWFVTDRRPGIDFALMEGRQPLGRDALRAELGAHAVFPHEQRAAYRQEVRDRLAGGADLERHLRLLHVVRNPRVGDRIANDLPDYLADALPQLSDAALDDAAQPLEDLEEFRRNVENLTRTAEGLDALGSVYTAYARSELRRRAASLLDDVDQVDRVARTATRLRREADAAAAPSEQSAAAVAELELRATTLDQEIRALERSDDYREGRALDDLRRQVAGLAAALDEATARHDTARRRLVELADSVGRAHAEVVLEHGALGEELSALVRESVEAGLGSPSPPAPAIRSTLRDDSDAEHSLPLHLEDPDLAPTRAALAAVLGHTQRRAEDVERLRRSLEQVAHAEGELRLAEQRLAEVTEQLDGAQQRANDAREAVTARLEEWRTASRSWLDQLAEHLAQAAPALLVPPGDPSLTDPGIVDAVDLLDSLDQTADELGSRVERVVEHHQRELADLEVRRGHEAAECERLEVELDELESRTEPDPPRQPWQREGRHRRLSEVVDFAPDLSPAQQVGLESALEAAGLLGAEVRADGSLLGEDGELVLAAGQPVAHPLSAHLVVTLPDDPTGLPDASSIQALLGSITTDLAADAATAVTLDGSFRIGALVGHLVKDAAEHIGVTARRTALERRRAEVRARLDDAAKLLAATDAELERASAHLGTARRMRTERPAMLEILRARAAAAAAVQHLEEVELLAVQRRADRDEADRLHAERDESCRALAEQLHVVPSNEGVARTESAVRAAAERCRAAQDRCRSLERVVGHWAESCARWHQGRADVETAELSLARATAEHEPLAMRLATLEDSVGARYDEILASIEQSRGELERAADELGRAKEQRVELATAAGRAETRADAAHDEVQRAEQAVVERLPRLRAALDVPGVWHAAVTVAGDGAADGPPLVEDSVDGARTLAGAIRTAVPEPDRGAVTADGVRQSLRARRDALGAGWDAEDDQPDDTLPLVIRVTGPGVATGRTPLPDAAAQVRTRLGRQAGLLTAKQDDALRNLLQGLIAKEVADKLHAAGELVDLMNGRLEGVTTSHGVGTRLRWRPRRELDPATTELLELLAVVPDLRTEDQDRRLMAALSERIDTARRDDPETPYRDLIATVLDYREWHELDVLVHRPNTPPQLLSRRTALSEGEKKLVSYLPLFAAVAASCDAIAVHEPAAPRFVLLDDAFAKVSEDNHARLFGLLVELDLDFIATSERLWGTHDTVPELAITEVLRDAELGVIALEHSHWDGHRRATT